MHAPFLSSAAELDRARPPRARLRARARGAALSVLARRRLDLAAGVRVVHYHHVFDDERDGFARQLAWLAGTFEPVSLSEAVARLRDGRTSGRELVVTFDDGFRNQLTNAAGPLAEHGFSACFFLITELVDAPADRVEAICRERLHLPRGVEPLGWSDAERLLDLGHEIGSHTVSHRDPGADTADELARSKETLEARLGRPVAHFSAPYGDEARFQPELSRLAREAGYESCASAIRGLNVSAADVYALRRHHLVATWPVGHVRYFLSRP